MKYVNLFICFLAKSEITVTVALVPFTFYELSFGRHWFLCWFFAVNVTHLFCVFIFTPNISVCRSHEKKKTNTNRKVLLQKHAGACAHFLNYIIALKQNQPPSDGQKALLAELFM